jgi:HAD superfamily hydrolase (TIGR01450 family)
VSNSRRRDVTRLSSCEAPLVAAYDLVMFDLDGVVYLGSEPVEGAQEELARLRQEGVKVAYVTNNASRTPDDVAEHLVGMGVDATAEDVVTSAQAVASLMAEALPQGARVLAVGSAGLVNALQERGLVVVTSMDQEPSAAVQGFGAHVDWTALAEVAHVVNSGMPWFASNTDRTIPTARGIAPGNGMLVAAVRAAVDVEPVVAGKPETALFDETVRRVGGTRPLVVGDRLDTDIEGANRVGADSLLVLTGVSRLPELATAGPHERPGFVAPTLGALFERHAPIEVEDGTASCAGWTAEVVDGVVRVQATEPDPSNLGLVRAAVSAAWQHVDTTGSPADMHHVEGRLQRPRTT